MAVCNVKRDRPHKRAILKLVPGPPTVDDLRREARKMRRRWPALRASLFALRDQWDARIDAGEEWGQGGWVEAGKERPRPKKAVPAWAKRDNATA